MEQTQVQDLHIQSRDYWLLLQGKGKVFIFQFFNPSFQPMLDYVDSKDRQGIFFEKPVEKIHLPEPAELALNDHSK